MVSTEAALPGEVREGAQEEVSIQELFDYIKGRLRDQHPSVKELIRKKGLRSRKSQVMGQRSVYFWSKGTILRGLALREDWPVSSIAFVLG